MITRRLPPLRLSTADLAKLDREIVLLKARIRAIESEVKELIQTTLRSATGRRSRRTAQTIVRV
jgi:hypothetical protein